jgi:PadR family transcriptional regulator PadR
VDGTENTGHSFLSYFKRATSPLAVLRCLSERPMYGYEISAELKERSGGKFSISLLYPVLYRLEEQGYVQIAATEVADGRARSYYGITQAGRDYLRMTLAEFEEITAVFRGMMETGAESAADLPRADLSKPDRKDETL